MMTSNERSENDGLADPESPMQGLDFSDFIVVDEDEGNDSEQDTEGKDLDNTQKNGIAEGFVEYAASENPDIENIRVKNVNNTPNSNKKNLVKVENEKNDSNSKEANLTSICDGNEKALVKHPANENISAKNVGDACNSNKENSLGVVENEGNKNNSKINETNLSPKCEVNKDTLVESKQKVSVEEKRSVEDEHAIVIHSDERIIIEETLVKRAAIDNSGNKDISFKNACNSNKENSVKVEENEKNNRNSNEVNLASKCEANKEVFVKRVTTDEKLGSENSVMGVNSACNSNTKKSVEVVKNEGSNSNSNEVNLVSKCGVTEETLVEHTAGDNNPDNENISVKNVCSACNSNKENFVKAEENEGNNSNSNEVNLISKYDANEETVEKHETSENNSGDETISVMDVGSACNTNNENFVEVLENKGNDSNSNKVNLISKCGANGETLVKLDTSGNENIGVIDFDSACKSNKENFIEMVENEGKNTKVNLIYKCDTNEETLVEPTVTVDSPDISVKNVDNAGNSNKENCVEAIENKRSNCNSNEVNLTSISDIKEETLVKNAATDNNPGNENVSSKNVKSACNSNKENSMEFKNKRNSSSSSEVNSNSKCEANKENPVESKQKICVEEKGSVDEGKRIAVIHNNEKNTTDVSKQVDSENKSIDTAIILEKEKNDEKEDKQITGTLRERLKDDIGVNKQVDPLINPEDKLMNTASIKEKEKSFDLKVKQITGILAERLENKHGLLNQVCSIEANVDDTTVLKDIDYKERNSSIKQELTEDNKTAGIVEKYGGNNTVGSDVASQMANVNVGNETSRKIEEVLSYMKEEVSRNMKEEIIEKGCAEIADTELQMSCDIKHPKIKNGKILSDESIFNSDKVFISLDNIPLPGTELDENCDVKTDKNDATTYHQKDSIISNKASSPISDKPNKRRKHIKKDNISNSKETSKNDKNKDSVQKVFDDFFIVDEDNTNEVSDMSISDDDIVKNEVDSGYKCSSNDKISRKNTLKDIGKKFNTSILRSHKRDYQKERLDKKKIVVKEKMVTKQEKTNFHVDVEPKKSQIKELIDDTKISCSSDVTPDDVTQCSDSTVKKHPFMFLLNSFKPTGDQLMITENDLPKHLTEAALVEVHTKSDLLKSLELLKNEKAIGVDVQHDNDNGYYRQITVLILSTRNVDYIIDTIALRTSILLLTEIFLNSNMVKIFYNTDVVLSLLQQDMNLFFVNIFVIQKALLALSPGDPVSLITKLASDYSIKRSDLQILKVSNFRLRPLTKLQQEFCRLCTRYLVHMYTDIKNKFIVLSVTRYIELLRDFNDICKVLYEDPKEAEYKDIVEDVERYHKCQLAVLKQLHQWRSDIAKHLNKHPNAILSIECLKKIAFDLPTDSRKIKDVYKSDFVNRDMRRIIQLVLVQKRKCGIKNQDKHDQTTQLTTNVPDCQVSKKISSPIKLPVINHNLVKPMLYKPPAYKKTAYPLKPLQQKRKLNEDNKALGNKKLHFTPSKTPMKYGNKFVSVQKSDHTPNIVNLQETVNKAKPNDFSNTNFNTLNDSQKLTPERQQFLQNLNYKAGQIPNAQNSGQNSRAGSQNTFITSQNLAPDNQFKIINNVSDQQKLLLGSVRSLNQDTRNQNSFVLQNQIMNTLLSCKSNIQNSSIDPQNYTPEQLRFLQSLDSSNTSGNVNAQNSQNVYIPDQLKLLQSLGYNLSENISAQNNLNVIQNYLNQMSSVDLNSGGTNKNINVQIPFNIIQDQRISNSLNSLQNLHNLNTSGTPENQSININPFNIILNQTAHDQLRLIQNLSHFNANKNALDQASLHFLQNQVSSNQLNTIEALNQNLNGQIPFNIINKSQQASSQLNTATDLRFANSLDANNTIGFNNNFSNIHHSNPNQLNLQNYNTSNLLNANIYNNVQNQTNDQTGFLQNLVPTSTQNVITNFQLQQPNVLNTVNSSQNYNRGNEVSNPLTGYAHLNVNLNPNNQFQPMDNNKIESSKPTENVKRPTRFDIKTKAKPVSCKGRIKFEIINGISSKLSNQKTNDTAKDSGAKNDNEDEMKPIQVIRNESSDGKNKSTRLDDTKSKSDHSKNNQDRKGLSTSKNNEDRKGLSTSKNLRKAKSPESNYYNSRLSKSIRFLSENSSTGTNKPVIKETTFTKPLQDEKSRCKGIKNVEVSDRIKKKPTEISNKEKHSDSVSDSGRIGVEAIFTNTGDPNDDIFAYKNYKKVTPSQIKSRKVTPPQIKSRLFEEDAFTDDVIDEFIEADPSDFNTKSSKIEQRQNACKQEDHYTLKTLKLRKAVSPKNLDDCTEVESSLPEPPPPPRISESPVKFLDDCTSNGGNRDNTSKHEDHFDLDFESIDKRIGKFNSIVEKSKHGKKRSHSRSSRGDGHKRRH